MGTVAILRVLLLSKLQRLPKRKGALVRDLRRPRSQDRSMSSGTLHPCFNFSRFYVAFFTFKYPRAKHLWGGGGGKLSALLTYKFIS